MQIIIELKDKDVEICEAVLKVDLEKMIKAFALATVESFKEIVLARKAGVPLTQYQARAFGEELGQRLFKDAKKETSELK